MLKKTVILAIVIISGGLGYKYILPFNINNNVIIKTIFRIIGEAAAAANLLLEFKIAAKKDAKDTNSKKGKVILVSSIAKSIFFSFPIKPGANKETKKGANISIKITKNNKINNNKLKT